MGDRVRLEADVLSTAVVVCNDAGWMAWICTPEGSYRVMVEGLDACTGKLYLVCEVMQ